ncbi:uncharacterized protein PpBr36_05608, partial [Pyricularia pennisetigena]|uniref:uncharacterized protein n=1 Tax=Pyricularia pennisetigena TaxID=1578925 RepID=UPI00114E6199
TDSAGEDPHQAAGVVKLIHDWSELFEISPAQKNLEQRSINNATLKHAHDDKWAFESSVWLATGRVPALRLPKAAAVLLFGDKEFTVVVDWCLASHIVPQVAACRLGHAHRRTIPAQEPSQKRVPKRSDGRWRA